MKNVLTFEKIDETAYDVYMGKIYRGFLEKQNGSWIFWELVKEPYPGVNLLNGGLYADPVEYESSMEATKKTLGDDLL